jgi:ribosome-associated toxin RatA of RatAB toxin-antitoxin module
MAKVEMEHVFSGSREKVFAGICQFDKYPQFIPGVSAIEKLPAKVAGSTCQVRYEVNVIKTFYYTLNMFAESPAKIWWNMDDSNLMKASDGSWLLSDSGAGKTKAIYSLDVKFKGLVPSAITDRVAKANLPAMMAGFQKIIDGL